MKTYFLLLVFLLLSNYVIAQEQKYHIAGKVLMDDYMRITPVDAYIKIKGEKKGYIVDFSGLFKIDNLSPGKYKLKFTRIDCFDYDTIIVLKNTSVDSVNIILSFWYYKKAFTPQAARREAESGCLGLYIYTETANLKQLYANPFWEKYQVGYRIYEKELVENKKQYFSAPLPVLIRFNREIFRYLDEKYGKEWRKDAPIDILGID